MKKIIIMLSLCALFFGCTREYGGVPTTKNYPISGPFTGLDVSNAFQVTVSDEVTDVVVTVGELAHDRVYVSVVDGKLRIGFKPNTRYKGEAIAIIPANANLRELDLSGASSFSGNLRGEEVEIDLSGASTYRGAVEATEIEVDLSGASDAFISGSCQNKMDMDLSGASTLKAANLSTQSVHGEMSGASDADVTICTELKVELSGASTLTYGTVSDECNPMIECPASGASTINHRR
ncbi:MAG: DUF2807 domain-containing protein [Bacteroidales bacterium]|nr:DUF2807 domain-containing protein [Bacteroidales bacterium]